MTTEELRALDVEIHRRVFGFTDIRRLVVSHGQDGVVLCGLDENEMRWREEHPDECDDSHARDWCYLPKYDHDETGDIFCNLIPAYSTDMRAAWEVVEKLTEGEYVKVRCEQSHYHGDYCTISAAHESQRDATSLVKQDVFGEWGETMPQAICLAALKAVAQ